MKKESFMIAGERVIYEFLTSENQLDYDSFFEFTKKRALRISKNKVAEINEEFIDNIINEIYNEIKDNNFDEYKYYLLEYFGALFAKKIRRIHFKRRNFSKR